jgi:hypothetical protein
VGEAALELELLASVLRSVARDLRHPEADLQDAAIARHVAARLRDVEQTLQTVRLEVAAAPYVGASGASYLEHDGEIYLIGAPIEHHQIGEKHCFRHDGTSYAITVEFKSGNPVARPVTRPGAS